MRSIRRSLLPLVMLCALAGCQTWQGKPLPAPGAQPLPSPVRLTLADGATQVMWAAAVEGDSIVGLIGPYAGQRTREAWALSQVRRIQAREVGPEGSVMGGVLIGVGLTLALLYGVIGPET
jgi:hypothetical protein